jgi:hypothetical protein
MTTITLNVISTATIPKISRIEKIRMDLNLPNVNTSKIQSNTMDRLSEEEIAVKRTYYKEIRALPYERQLEKLEELIDSGEFPLPLHNCKYCLCNTTETMSKLVQLTLKATSTPLVKVKDFLEYRYRAIQNNLEMYTDGRLNQ